MAHTGSLSARPTTAASVLLFFDFCCSSSVRTADKLPGIRSSVTPVQVEIISFLKAALSVPVSKVGIYFLKNTHKQE